MMDKRKFDGTVDESSCSGAMLHVCKSDMIVQSCEKSGAQHLAKSGFTASRLACRLADQNSDKIQKFKACCRLK